MFSITEWLTVANLEESNTTQQATSNIETTEEVEQQQTIQQLVDGSSGIVITNSNSKKATTKVTIENIKKENDDDGPLVDHYGRFDGEFCMYLHTLQIFILKDVFSLPSAGWHVVGCLVLFSYIC